MQSTPPNVRLYEDGDVRVLACYTCGTVETLASTAATHACQETLFVPVRPASRA